MPAKQIEISIPELHRVWNSKLHIDEVAKRLKITRTRLYALAREHKLPRRPLVRPEKFEFDEETDPSPEDIAQQTALLRSTWSETEMLRRAGKSTNTRWDMPQYAYNGPEHGFSPLP
jgi:hypothetical protein